MEQNLFKIDLFHSPSSNAYKNWIYIQTLGWYRCMHDDPEYFNEGFPGYELIYTLNGRGWVEINNKRYLIPPRSLALFDTSVRHGAGAVKGEIWELLYVDFGWNGFDSIYESITDKGIVFQPLLPDVIEKDLWDIFYMKKNKAIHFELSAFQKILTIITSLYNYHYSLQDYKDIVKKDHREVESVMEYIQNHYTEPINLSGLSKMVGYSKDYISKLFKKETGYTITEYYIKCKLEAAKSLLLNSSCTIKEVALKTGFEHPSYFNRLFKEKVGITPSEFKRKKHFFKNI